MQLEVSNGEIFDKWTILKIKLDKSKDSDSHKHISNELMHVKSAMDSILRQNSDKIDQLKLLTDYLLSVNLLLWNTEDKLRALENSQTFDSTFIAAARRVYEFNDHRASLKRQINTLTNSPLVEVKIYDGIKTIDSSV